MAELIIEAEPRQAGSSNAARRLRAERKLPAVLYGGAEESHPITLDPREITSILKSESGQNTVFKLKVAGGSEENVMIFDVQVDPITHHLQHADLVRIAMDVAIEVEVPIEFVGEPVGVRVSLGVLDISLREITVECLPGNIPDTVQVDVSELDINDSIRVEDIVIPGDVTLVTEGDRSVASVVPPVSEEELEADLGVEGEEPEMEGEEAEAAAADAAAEPAAEAAEEKKEEESSD